jgi:hypothetical protein
MKEYIAWFRMWLFLREMMDAKCAGPIIARMVDNRATEEDLASIHLASFPKNLPHDIREAAVSHIARAFSAETETGPKPPEKEAGSKPPSN